jgi:hypothetical protein
LYDCPKRPSHSEQPVPQGFSESCFCYGWDSLFYSLNRWLIPVHVGTLALGINAPTKTCVFCGDSPFLTALTVGVPV